MTDWCRILVTGSRNWARYDVIRDILDDLLFVHPLTIVHGDCPTGADAHAKRWATGATVWGMATGAAQVRHELYPAPWTSFDKSAGPLRNRYMTDLGADICLAFPLADSRGTVSCMNFARAADIPVFNFGVDVPGFESAQ